MAKYKKEKKRRREDSDSSDSSDEERDHKKAKKHKKEKKRSKESKKDKKEEKQRLKEAKAFLKNKLKESPDDAPLDPDTEIQPISAESYFEKNPEFTAWLRDERQLFFGDLPTAEARRLFDEFVAAWNGRRLKRRFYQGIAPADARRSQHAWRIRGAPGVEAVQLGMAAALEEEREAAAGARAAEQADRRRWRSDQKLALDEMLPKATGREAQVEARIARREEARAREASPDAPPLGGGDLYGDGDSFAAARAREAERQAFRQRKQSQRAELADARARDAAAKEEDRMAQFRALVSGGPIAIPKRQQ